MLCVSDLFNISNAPGVQPPARPIPSSRSSAIALISKFEMKYWYRGISGNPPELMWRSEFDSNPFPIPTLGGEPRFCKIPPKTVHDVFKTPLNAVWGTVAPQILASMKERGLEYSVLKTARFSTVEDQWQRNLWPSRGVDRRSSQHHLERRGCS